MDKPKRIDTPEIAKIIRADLKRNYPGQTFTVRSEKYTGGSSIQVQWENGPTTTEVNDIIGDYAGKGFDGSIDLAYYYHHLQMPDGRIIRSGTHGTQASGGYVQAWEEEHPGAIKVHMNVSSIFTERSLTEDAVQQIVDRMIAEGICTQEDVTIFPEQKYSWGATGAYAKWHPTLKTEQNGWSEMDCERKFSQYLSETSFYQAPAPTTTSATAPPCAMTITQERDWLWVSFPIKPPDDRIAQLQKMGARWSKRRVAWYFTNAAVLPALQAMTQPA